MRRANELCHLRVHLDRLENGMKGPGPARETSGDYEPRQDWQVSPGDGSLCTRSPGLQMNVDDLKWY